MIISAKSNDRVSVSKKEKKATLYSNGQQGGYGLWCTNTDKKGDLIEEVKNSKVNSINNNMGNNKDTKDDELIKKFQNFEFLSEIDKKLIDKLKAQNQDLSLKLEMSLAKQADAEFKASRAENNKQMTIELSQQQTNDIEELKEKIALQDEDIINLNEALSSAKKEISRLQSEVQIESEKSTNYYEHYQKLLIDKERRENALSSEISALNNQLNNFSMERDNLLKVVSTIPHANEVVNNLQKKIKTSKMIK